MLNARDEIIFDGIDVLAMQIPRTQRTAGRAEFHVQADRIAVSRQFVEQQVFGCLFENRFFVRQEIGIAGGSGLADLITDVVTVAVGVGRVISNQVCVDDAGILGAVDVVMLFICYKPLPNIISNKGALF